LGIYTHASDATAVRELSVNVMAVAIVSPFTALLYVAGHKAATARELHGQVLHAS